MNFFPAILDIISQSVSSVSAALKCRIGNFRYVENISALIQELIAIVKLTTLSFLINGEGSKIFPTGRVENFFYYIKIHVKG